MIKISGLTKYYGGITAVNDLSFEIKEGEVFGLLGPNGAGKTTTIKMLTTLSRPDAGSYMIDGFDVVKDPYEIKSRIGVMPQENNLDRELTAYENLLIYGMLHGVKDMKKKITDTLKMIDLWERRASVVSGLSGGMQRRLLLARAFLPEPSILFLDEPTVGLDPQMRRHIWDIIRKTRVEGRTVVITTHYIEEAEALCDRVGILSKGSLIALDTPDNLKAAVGRYVVEFLEKDGRLIQRICKNYNNARKVTKIVRERGKGVIRRRSNLEDVFVKLTGESIEREELSETEEKIL